MREERHHTDARLVVAVDRRLHDRETVRAQCCAAGFPHGCERRVARGKKGVESVLLRGLDRALRLRERSGDLADAFAGCEGRALRRRKLCAHHHHVVSFVVIHRQILHLSMR